VADAVGVDLGGTKIAAGLVDDSGRMLARREVPTGEPAPETVIASIAALVRELDPHAECEVGVGAAGLVDYERGFYRYGPNLGLRDVELAESLSKRLGVRVLLDNDANVACWGEHRFGSGRGTRHFLCVTLGTGIGGGMVLNGRPYRGAHGGAAEIGHMVVDVDGPMCGCGRRGCWEQLASGKALERIAREGLAPGSVLYHRASRDPAKLNGPMVTDAARENDPYATQVLDEWAHWVGLGLASLVNILEPERIAIGGGLSSDWDLYGAAAVRAMTDRMEAPTYRAAPEVVPAELGRDAGIVGAALLVGGMRV
jgi:glucokinase